MEYIKYCPGEFLDAVRAAGVEPSKDLIKLDAELSGMDPPFTREEWRQVYDHLTWHLLESCTDAAERRELLAGRDTCPCCDQWLGHNNPPTDGSADDPPPIIKARNAQYRRQTSFDFGKRR